MDVVVVGGGVVGLTSAYYLLQQGRKVTIIEKCAVACHSSGKAGGFLTDADSGWHRGPMVSLVKHSFTLHEEFVEKFGAKSIGFRRVKCVGRGAGDMQTPEWLDSKFQYDMGPQGGMAQISPWKFMDALCQEVKNLGGEVMIGRVTGVIVEEAAVKGVTLQKNGLEETVPCSALVLCMGAWARDACMWFPNSALPRQTVSSKYTSVIWDDVEVGKSETMVFVMGEHHVEIYPRSDECYANGCPTEAELPENPLDIVPTCETIEDVKSETVSAVPRLKDAPVLRTSACFLAGSDDHTPVIGRIQNTTNAVIACGGGCWGVLCGPAMGQASAHLITGEETAFDVEPFSPARFGPPVGDDGATLPFARTCWR